MTHPMQAADELADEALIKLVDRLFDRWQLDDETRHQLLFANPGPCSAEPNDKSTGIERARQLLTVHAGLRCLFPENPEMRWTWVTRRNSAFHGSTPLEMLLTGQAGIDRVLQLVRQNLGT